MIAAAGVVGDSTATVIGAMIVAPLMTPIQATMLAVVIGDRANLARSIGLVIAGAASAVAIGYVVGPFVVTDVVAATNSQVASRVSPRLIDLLAALATGVVGSVALARKDISDTLPGVAIAVSLVPPLSVVGLTLESGEPHQALGALLLFVTNVVAILARGVGRHGRLRCLPDRSDDTMVRAARAAVPGDLRDHHDGPRRRHPVDVDFGEDRPRRRRTGRRADAGQHWARVSAGSSRASTSRRARSSPGSKERPRCPTRTRSADS